MKTKQKHDLKKTCPQCSKIYQVRAPSELKIRKYCSKKCQQDSQKKDKQVIVCQTCNKKKYVLPCLADAKYCSRKCKNIGHKKIKEEGLRQCNKCQEVLPINNFCTGSYRCNQCEKFRARITSKTARGKYAFSKCHAKRRGLEWSITFEVYSDLIEKPCTYCKRDTNETGVGLDRIDNKLGYTEKNVVTCCGLCNKTRSDNFTHEEMFVLAKSIVTILNSRQANSKAF